MLGSSSTEKKITSSQPIVPAWQALTDDDIRELKVIAPNAVVLTSFEDSDTDTASEDTDDEEQQGMPEPLTSLFSSANTELSPQEILVKSEEVFLGLETKLKAHGCQKLESVTRQQSKSTCWHAHRAGRITSTKFYHITTTDKISTNYLQNIMQYNQTQLNIPSVLWGQQMEETARKAYTDYMEQTHEDFKVSPSGLVVRPSEPHLGSSPDGIITCACCSRGVLEVKCPYKYRDALQGCEKDAQFCLDKTDKLKPSHQYYYQVQLHIHVCDVSYCDFVVWTKNEFVLQRILRDEDLLQQSLPKAEQVFVTCVLPELLTRRHDPAMETGRACKSCRRPDFGKTVNCGKCNSHFHYSCAQIRRKPAKWLCQECLGGTCSSGSLG
ncbi:uncharacterized protein [Pagrus major]|uniref:uncharacterized protein n=1 Tax=Pagrus major TaxID=143350 RepID=UPI003CC84705